MKRLLLIIALLVVVIPFTPFLKKDYWQKKEIQIHADERRNERNQEEVNRIHGTIMSAPTGDSVIIRLGVEKLLVNLTGIKAPEFPECLAQESRNGLSSLLVDKDVILEEKEKGNKNILIDDQDAGALMLWRGLVKIDGSEHEKQNEYNSRELRSKEQGIGIWSEACEQIDSI